MNCEEVREDVIVPRRVFDTLQDEGYWGRWYEIRPDCTSHLEAWMRLETEREKYCIPARFSSFESFKRSFYLQINQKKAVKRALSNNLLPNTPV